MIRISRIFFICLLLFFIQVFAMPVMACVQGMEWGMDKLAVEQHLGISLNANDDASSQDSFEVHQIQIGSLPVSRLRLKLDETRGLQHLAYELEDESMTEVLAGLRHRYGPPVTTLSNDNSSDNNQQWIWHTGDDVITVLRSSPNKSFLLAYRPRRIDPSIL